MRAIYRYEVPVDGQWHAIDLYDALRGWPNRNPILSVASRTPEIVEFWAEFDDDAEKGGIFTRHFQVFGTGQPLPDGHIQYVGTTLAADGQLVWHLHEAIPDMLGRLP